MTDIDYPPSRTRRFGAALASIEDRLATAEQRIADLEADEDATDQALAEARQDRATAANQRDALQWAVAQFGEDAELTLRAFTATSRARVLDTLNRTVVGAVGGQQTRNWLIAGSIEAAPWLDGDEDLAEQASVTGALPPGLVDWLDAELEELNDLTAGN